jgi:hypothetical protein
MSLKSGGLHEKHAVATWNLEPSQHLLEDRGKPRKAVSRWPVAGPSVRVLITSQQSGKLKLKKFPRPKFSLTCVLTFCSRITPTYISVRTSKRTPHFTITNVNFLTLCKEIVCVYMDNHVEPTNTKC